MPANYVFDADAIVYCLQIMLTDQIGLPFMARRVYGLFVLRRHELGSFAKRYTSSPHHAAQNGV